MAEIGKAGINKSGAGRGSFRLTPVWLSLGHAAYWRSFACGRFGCIAGGRDFAWLTLLLALVVSMALLLVGSRAGLLERFTDALLGTLRPHGVPIWVTAHWENQDGIESSLLRQLRELEGPSSGTRSGITVHPYRRLEGSRPRVLLPDDNIWKAGPPFVGWAVYSKDPLWQLETPTDWQDDSWKTPDEWLGLPLTVVLSESLFRSQFNYPLYRDSLRQALKERAPELPAELSRESFRQTFKTLWLKVTVADEERLLPFQVRWVHHIPAMEKVAFLFPLSTFHALLAAHHFPELKFEPTNHGEGDTKIQQHLLSKNYPRAEISSFVQCVQEELAASGLTGLASLKANRCLKPRLPEKERLAGLGNATSEWDTLNHDNRNQLWIPCPRLPTNDPVHGALCPGMDDDPAMRALLVPWDVTSYGTSFSAVHVYVPSPSTLNQAIGKLLAMKSADGKPALNIHPMYQDALNRFNLLSDMLATMVPAFSLTFGLFLAFLLLAQIGTLIGHRRLHYGILLSRGFSASGIYAKITFQMLLATLVGGAFSIAVMVPALRHLLERGFHKIVQDYESLLPPGYDYQVLPLTLEMIGLTVAAVFLAVVVVTHFLVFRLPLRGNTAPSDLLHGDMTAPQRQEIRRSNP
ncbi:MAG: hypothetical protein HQL57_07180 [Magnetococcales bacterium]|nr:hypothetical protein [Magnetococcales bacterium]MBF0156952.1 hypothetical protein [Magnetococcales bacterium]